MRGDWWLELMSNSGWYLSVWRSLLLFDVATYGKVSFLALEKPAKLRNFVPVSLVCCDYPAGCVTVTESLLTNVIISILKPLQWYPGIETWDSEAKILFVEDWCTLASVCWHTLCFERSLGDLITNVAMFPNIYLSSVLMVCVFSVVPVRLLLTTRLNRPWWVLSGIVAFISWSLQFNYFSILG